ncbi:MAG: hypothetical protein OXE83_03375 [Gammaproteobacteria bacterium]|nr:hypothetical protein [Gammaproteobacteria bacterium]
MSGPSLPIAGHSAGRSAGLSLLEMLVVLVLASLLATLLVQGLGFFLSSSETVRRHASRAAEAHQQQHWFASSVRSMVPYLDPQRAFAGDAASFAGITLEPLGAEPGLPREVRWSIEPDGASLRYAESGGSEADAVAWTVLHAPGQALRFEYADRAGAWHPSWPQAAAPREWIPGQVRLVGEDGRTLLSAHLSLHPVPVANFLEPL